MATLRLAGAKNKLKPKYSNINILLVAWNIKPLQGQTVPRPGAVQVFAFLY
ncbi:hypothetical protein PGB28_14300 [Primorskyibacter aestuariivivens]|uniref:hypothetical protein n=1 Tax=Primorskyibacter aestuariivivens TaxID=1888912 RepID=UPI002301AD85|nr:hypothetical protein [Primorskyibacter aestuariivivens]MDA7429638.1 hypothetical protein [Primorskyibacter aestuariivivens]